MGAGEKVGTLLPKIINTVNTSSRNHNNQITTSNTQSSKSQAIRGNLSASLAEDEPINDEEAYEQDMFEYEENNQRGNSHLPQILSKEQ